MSALRAGEVLAPREILPPVYADLRALAAARMARLGPGHTLQATELAHEAYLRLVGSGDPGWRGRASSPIEVRHTLVSLLVFTRERVYELKQALDLGFIDSRTLARRRFLATRRCA